MYPKPCWILCTPRTGSSFLCELLNNSGSFPEMKHNSLKNYRCPLEKGQAFSEWCRLYDGFYDFIENPPPYSKIIFHQFFEVMNNISKEKRYGVGFYKEKYDNEKAIKISKKYSAKYIMNSIFPDIKYILLKRNPISNAVSIYFSRITKKYHIYDYNSLKEYLNSKIEIDDFKLLKCYKDSKLNNNIWLNFLGKEKFLSINYDDLINKTEDTLENISDYIGISINYKNVISKINKNPRIFRMTRDESKEVENKLLKLIKIKMI